MKTIILTTCLGLLLLVMQAHSQVYNMNPDPNGSPWWTNDILAQCMIFV